MSEATKRLAITPEAKQEFDQVQRELSAELKRDIPQSEVITLLIDYYHTTEEERSE